MSKKKTTSSKSSREEQLEKENAKLRKALSQLIDTWRGHDQAYGETCFEACQKAKALLEVENNKLKNR